MLRLRRQAQIYVLAVTAGSVVFLWLQLRSAAFDLQLVAAAFVFVVLGSVAEAKPVQVLEYGFVSVSPVFQSASYILFKSGVAAAIAATSSIVADCIGGRPAFKTMFNAAQYIMCVGTAALI